MVAIEPVATAATGLAAASANPGAAPARMLTPAPDSSGPDVGTGAPVVSDAVAPVSDETAGQDGDGDEDEDEDEDGDGDGDGDEDEDEVASQDDDGVDEDDDEEDGEETEEELDSEFLNALPPDLREELLATNRAIARLNTSAGGGGGGGGGGSGSGGGGGNQLEAIDPSFLAALPLDMQAEVVRQQAMEVRRQLQERAAQTAQATAVAAAAEAEAAAVSAARASAAAAAAVVVGQGSSAAGGGADAAVVAAAAAAATAAAALAAASAAAAAAVGASPGGGGGGGAGGVGAGGDAMDNASIIATFPEELRQEVLLSADEAMLATLPPALLAEARTLRERHMAQYRQARAAAAEAGEEEEEEEDDDGGGGRGRGRGGRGGGDGGAGGAGTAASFSRQLRSMLGLSGRGPGMSGGHRRGGVTGPGGTAADRAVMAAGPTSALVDRRALLVLVRLLRLAPPLSRGLLPRVLLNLAAHGGTRDAVLRMLLATLRASVEANERGAGVAVSEGGSSGSVAGGVSGRGCGKLYGRNVHVICAQPDAAARLLARRALETIVFLARHSMGVARRIPALAVTAAASAEAASADDTTDAATVAAAEETADPKGKRPATAVVVAAARVASSGLIPDADEDGDAAADGIDSALLLLLRLLGSPAFTPHVTHLELTLQLLETILKACAVERDEYVFDHLIRKREEYRVAKAEAEAAAAAVAAATAALASANVDAAAVTAATASLATATAALTGAAAAGAGTETAAAAVAAATAALAAAAAVVAAALARTEAGTAAASALVPAVGSFQGASGGLGAGAGPSDPTLKAADNTMEGAMSASTSSIVAPAGTTAPPRRRTAASRVRVVLASAPPESLRAVAALLGRDSLTDAVYARAGDTVKMFASVAPGCRPALAAALAAEATGRLGDATHALNSVRMSATIAAAGVEAAAGAMGTGSAVEVAAAATTAAVASAAASAAAARLPASAASAGCAILRLVHATAALLKYDEKAEVYLEVEEANEALERAKAVDAMSTLAVHKPKAVKEAEAEATRRNRGRLLQSFAAQLAPVWEALSGAATALEPQIAAAAASAATPGVGSAGAAAPALPAGARQILPVVEAYFALAAAVNDASKKPAPAAPEPFASPGGAAAGEAAAALAADAPAPSFNLSAPVAARPHAAAVDSQQDERAAFGLARVSSPAFGLIRSASAAFGATGSDGASGSSGGGGGQSGPESSGGRPDDPGGVTSVWNFANKHRAVVNALVRTQPALLDGSLRLLMEKPRLLDFDNKRSHIRAKLRRLAEDPHSGHIHGVRGEESRNAVTKRVVIKTDR
jgi:E3 ubiquitin-protein ligase HUWE1